MQKINRMWDTQNSAPKGGKINSLTNSLTAFNRMSSRESSVKALAWILLRAVKPTFEVPYAMHG